MKYETVAQATLKTARLTLRPLKASDAGLISLYADDPRVARMSRRIPHPNPPGAVERFIATVLNGTAGETVWAIDHAASSDEHLVGLIGLTPDGELGYWVGAPFWDTGFATEAVEAVVQHAFSTGYAVLKAEVFQDNPASARVLTKVGFAFVGEGESYSSARAVTVPVWKYVLEAG